MRFRNFSIFFIPCLSLIVAVASAFAADRVLDRRTDSTDVISASIQRALQTKYPLARIELTGSIRWNRGQLPVSPADVRIVSENGKGEVAFTVTGESSASDEPGSYPVVSEGIVSFGAWMPAYIALRRIQPGEKIAADTLIQQDVNVASGQAREYRGVIISQESEIRGLESRQTILEGQFLVQTAVRKVPDIRKGDSVRIHLLTGSLIVNTVGIAEEPGYIDSPIQVLTGKGKRLLVGNLQAGKVVEVKL